jgi:ferric-dicitrate binding protein FerR (iron transport regulator)
MTEKEDQIRRMMDVPLPFVPGDTVERAAAIGLRLRHRRRLARRAALAVLLAAALVALVWLAVADPWASTSTTPPPAKF